MDKKDIQSTKQFNVFSSHLDREWYVSFEETRIFTAAIIDKVLEQLGKWDKYIFMLDGQVSMLEDYLEIYPERREEITKYIQEGRFLIGPWYIQPDECIPHGESLVRNLLMGDKLSKKYGEPMKVGYLPDTFGHVSQMPQILRQFHIPTAFIMRGCSSDTPREFIWKGIDGSEVICLKYEYGNCSVMYPNEGMAMIKTKEEMDSIVEQAVQQKNDHGVADFILMTVCGDMLPPLDDPNELGLVTYDCLSDCFEEIDKVKDKLTTIRGELRDNPEIYDNLGHTVAVRIYMKQENQLAQSSLIHFAEPLCALAYGATSKYPAGFINKAWQYLVENHTHDGICACSNNDVCREIMTRFQKSRNISETYTRIAMESLVEQIDTSFMTEKEESIEEKNYKAVVVYNPLAFEWKGPVCVKIAYPFSKAPKKFKISDEQGNIYENQIVNVSEREVIKSGFNSVQLFEKEMVYSVVLQNANLPACGIKTFQLEKQDDLVSEEKSLLLISEDKRRIENDWYVLKINKNGSLELQDKVHNQRYQDLNYFVEEGDGGDTYGFRSIPDGKMFDSRDLEWNLEVISEGPLAVVCELSAKWNLPAEMTKHGLGRSNDLVENQIKYRLCMYAESPVIEVKLHINNKSRDHRIRTHFHTKMQNACVWADGQFAVEKRDADTRHYPMQTLCAICGDHTGLAVFGKGLHQYQYMNDEDGTIALTVHRGQGVLYRPFFEKYNEEFSECQCLGEWEAEYAIYPFGAMQKELPANVIREAAKFQAGTYSMQTGKHYGMLKSVQSYIEVENEELQLVSLKLSEDRRRIVARLYNSSLNNVRANISSTLPIEGVVRMNLKEEIVENITMENNTISLNVGPGEIVTLGFGGVFSPIQE